MADRVQVFNVKGHAAQEVCGIKEREKTSDLILSNSQCGISTDLTVTEETVPWGPFSVILEYPGTERTDFSYSASICLHSLTFPVEFSFSKTILTSLTLIPADF